MKEKIVLYALGAVVLTACEHKKVKSDVEYPVEEMSDSLVVSSDSLAFVTEIEEEEDLPETADELFDDFVFEFARLKKVQMERVKFPLPVIKNNDTTWVREDQWKHESLFLRQDYYTVFFNDEKQMELEKRTDLDHVDVEWIIPDVRQVKVYSFEREQGQWSLVQEAIRPFRSSVLADFILFYQRFVSDADFQNKSVADPLRFVTTDPDDDFCVIEGTLSHEQWEAFRPQLPSGTLTNVRYGQSYRNTNGMIMVKRGIANGLMDVLSFRKYDDGWRLVSYEN